MPVGGFSALEAGGLEFEAKITSTVIIHCMMAATGGLMYGYAIRVSAQLISMDSFLNKFFPVAYRRMMEHKNNSNYCTYLDKELRLFLSYIFLAGLAATFLASYTTRRLGRRRTMLIAGGFSIAGVILNAAAQDTAMLITGSILLGCGIGFATQVVPLFLSEIAPTRIRGALNILFPLNMTIGFIFGNLVSYGTKKIKGGWGWRLSLGSAGIPAVLFTFGALFVVETPSSLIERGHLEEGKAVLRKIRGTDNIEPELLKLVDASRIAKQVKRPFRNLVMRRNRPQLVMAVALQIFQRLMGANTIIVFQPIFLKTIGFGSLASFYSIVISEVFIVISTIVSMYFVDKIGRRRLFLEAGVHMFLSHAVMAIIFGIKVKDHSVNLNLTHSQAIFVMILVCTFVSSYAFSWGPLGWLIPSEIFPLETRSEGQSVTACVNFLFILVAMHALDPMLCNFKFGVLLFFLGWILIVSFFVFFLVPETKNIPIEEMTERVWKRHWLWKRFMDDYGDKEIGEIVDGKKNGHS